MDTLHERVLTRVRSETLNIYRSLKFLKTVCREQGRKCTCKVALRHIQLFVLGTLLRSSSRLIHLMVTRSTAVHSFTYVTECHRYYKDLLLFVMTVRWRIYCLYVGVYCVFITFIGHGLQICAAQNILCLLAYKQFSYSFLEKFIIYMSECHLSINLCLSVYLSIYLSICLSIYYYYYYYYYYSKPEG